MIINELGKFIIIDEIRNNATASEVYFLSRLLGNEMLSLSENWPGRIYTSPFIFDVLVKKKPKVDPKCFRILTVNVQLKLKSKNKVIWVTMFEPEEIRNSAIFYFDDSIKTYLYTGAFNEMTSLYKNEQFMLCLQKGIDCVYIDTTLCKCNPYICTEDTIDDIKSISLKHPDSKLAVVIPNFGYEKLLVELIHAFPQNVYPTRTQRYILAKLGLKDLLGKACKTSAIIVLLPGVLTEDLEIDNITTIYITVGDAPTKSNEYGVYLRQWSPLPSLVDLNTLLEKIRPNQIIPIKQDPLDDADAELPSHFKWLVKQTSKEDKSVDIDDMSSAESWSENGSFESIGSLFSFENSSQNDSPTISLPPTELFDPNMQSTTKAAPEVFNNRTKKVEEPIQIKTESKPLQTSKCINLTKKRTRVIRHRTDIPFTESDEDDK